MNPDDRQQIKHVLSRIPPKEWGSFIQSSAGEEFRRCLEAMRAAVGKKRGPQPRPTPELIGLYGYRLLADASVGPWVRRQILENLASTKWEKLAAIYRGTSSVRAKRLHGSMTQHGSGSQVMADYWHQGSQWAQSFCQFADLPNVLAQRRSNELLGDEAISPAEPLPPLHDFQEEVYHRLRTLVRQTAGHAAMLSLPTGAGKTRVAVEAICDHFAEDVEARRRRNVVIWIAQSEELLVQAWECFRQVWQVPPERSHGRVTRSVDLALVRAWGGRKPDDVQIGDTPTILIAGIDQLSSWAKKKQEFFEHFPRKRLACVIVDEAHSLVTAEQRKVLEALGVKAKHHWRTLLGAPLVLGLTATPWRTNDKESKSLQRFFQEDLVVPKKLGNKPIAKLQKLGILANVTAKRLRIHGTKLMSPDQLRRFNHFRQIPDDYLIQLGLEDGRNVKILHSLTRLPAASRVLIFACSIEHAQILAIALNRIFGNEQAAVVTGKTPRGERAELIDRFRRGDGLRFLCNVGVLTAGFDAPKTDVVCITRPTTSALRYEQMVGRGLRGPRNGGTETCTVMDVQDDGLPSGIQSYARVLSVWDSRVDSNTN